MPPAVRLTKHARHHAHCSTRHIPLRHVYFSNIKLRAMFCLALGQLEQPLHAHIIYHHLCCKQELCNTELLHVSGNTSYIMQHKAIMQACEYCVMLHTAKGESAQLLTFGVAATAKYRFMPMSPARAPVKVNASVTIVSTCNHKVHSHWRQSAQKPCTSMTP